MTKPVAKAEISSFVKGIISEASPLNFPSDASLDEQNFELHRDGSRRRRLGIDFEVASVLTESGQTEESLRLNATSSYSWRGAAGNPENQFSVVQFGNTLFFFKANTSSISADGYLSSVTLSSYSQTKEYAYASVDGYLIVTGGFEEVAVISYEDEVFTVSYVRLRTRDMWGVEVVDNEYETDTLFRDPTAPQTQIYNFRNQSWAIQRSITTSTFGDTLKQYRDTLGKYPSNSESVWEGIIVDPETAKEVYDANNSQALFGSKTSTSKGFFIIDLLDRGASRLEEFNKIKNAHSLDYPVTALPQDKSVGGASVVESYAGRVFYAGFGGETTGGDARSPNLANMVFFSRIVRNRTDINKCFQEGDPTSRDSSDIVDTDGGFIRVSGANNILRLINIGNILLVIADNGVWSIKGGGEYGFTATNYLINKLSNFGSGASKSIVSTGDAVFYWAEDGICIINKDQFGDYKISNISINTIQSLYDSIDNEVKNKVIGVYDEYDKKIKWLIKYTPDQPFVEELILDISLSSFTRNRFFCTYVDIIGYIKTPGYSISSSIEEAYVDGDLVLSDTDAVLVTLDQRTSEKRGMKYVAAQAIDGDVYFSFAELRDTTFTDWPSVEGGFDAYGYLLTGALTANDSGIYKQIPYITVHMERTEDGVEEIDGELIPKNQSGCKLRSMWDWSNTPVSKKWSPSQQVYRYRRAKFIEDEEDSYDNGFSTVSSKSKLRGRGRAVSLLFETEPSKDCHIYGWALQITGNNQ